MRTSVHEIPVELMYRRRALPHGISIEQIAAALAALPTARVSVHGTIRVKGRDTPVFGDGLVDFGRDIGFTSLTTHGTQIEQLTVGRDKFQRLPASEHQATGKLWLWSPEPHDFWRQMVAAMPHIAS